MVGGEGRDGSVEEGRGDGTLVGFGGSMGAPASGELQQ